MSRKLAIATLLTVWVLLLAGGLTVYLTMRSVLISDLDEVLFARAAALPELLHGPSDNARIPQYDWNDTYEIRDAAGQAVAANRDDHREPTLLAAYFSTSADGRKQRTVTVRSISSTTLQPVTVIYNGSAERIDRLLNRLALWLVAFGAGTGVVTAAVGFFITRATLRPLRDTADLMSGINEQKLHRRLACDALSPELVPVANGLNDMLTRLEQAFAKRRGFLADASHQLSGLVAALLESVENAMKGAQSDDHHEVMRQCLPQLQVLRRLVERLEEQARSELSVGDFADAVDVSELLNQCSDAAAEAALPQSIELVRSIPADLKCYICSQRLRSVVSDLLANAVEFNKPQGKVEISCLHDGQKLRIRISDTGVGMSAEDRTRLFRAFDRAAGADPQHLGLGLFLVQSHVRAMEGSIHIDSTPGEGTAIDVVLPCTRLHAGKKRVAATVARRHIVT